MNLRPYQQEAHDAIIDHVKQSTAPIVAELATGAGKSVIIAKLAKTIHAMSGGKSILCLAPSAELVTQNREKYLTTGEPASIFSASAGAKCMRHPVVFGTPQSVKNSVEKFGNRFAMIIIDEAHGMTPSVKAIIEHFKSVNPLLRIVGLTATPYRMGSGYIYWIDDKNVALPADVAKHPYFTKLVYKVGARFLIDQGFLTDPIIGEIGAGQYKTDNLKLNNIGKFDQSEIDKAFNGRGRLTAEIVADIVAQSRNRLGVMIFAATVQHAHEIMESLPLELSRIVTGETPKEERKKILQDFKAKRIKYLVNVSVLTTGFDAPHVDVVALMRATESVGLLQQIIGRGLRLSNGKNDCLILDYAQNIDRHCPDGDIFNPAIKAVGGAKGEEFLSIECPECHIINQFSPRKNEGGYLINKEGYFTDLNGVVIRTSTGNDPLPAHYGRRCNGIEFTAKHPEGLRCGYRWSMKICKACEAENDIAARYCRECKGELIDPNEKLVLEFKALKKDPTKTQIDEVLDFKAIPTMSKAGNPCLRVEFQTPYRSFTVWFQTNTNNVKAQSDYYNFVKHRDTINTVEYVKESSGFYRVLSYNKPKNEEPKND